MSEHAPSRILFRGVTFGSEVTVTIEVTKRGNLTAGEAVRIEDDLADALAAADTSRVRWETYGPGETT